MKKEKTNAPKILTNKDLDYLKDIFGWNYTLYKLSENSIEFIEDKEIKKIFKESSKMLNNNMNMILNILTESDINE